MLAIWNVFRLVSGTKKIHNTLTHFIIKLSTVIHHEINKHNTQVSMAYRGGINASKMHCLYNKSMSQPC